MPSASSQVSDECPECGSIRLVRDHESGEVACMECGYVLFMNIADRGPEWRAFNAEQRMKRARVGAPSTYTIHDKGLSTMIDRNDRDIFGKKISGSQKAQIYRLRKWHRRIRVSGNTERNLAIALSEIGKVSDSLSLPKSILETASILYRKALKEHLTRGRSIHGMGAASVYLACRRCGVVRTLDQISRSSKISRKELSRCYRFMVKKLDIFIPSIKPDQYVSKFSNQLILSGKTEGIAKKILVSARQLRLIGGRGPAGLAAAAVYVASVLTGERRTQREVAEVAEVTEVTVRNRYRELVERLSLLVTV